MVIKQKVRNVMTEMIMTKMVAIQPDISNLASFVIQTVY